jgi:hypothetical protein
MIALCTKRLPSNQIRRYWRAGKIKEFYNKSFASVWYVKMGQTVMERITFSSISECVPCDWHPSSGYGNLWRIQNKAIQQKRNKFCSKGNGYVHDAIARERTKSLGSKSRYLTLRHMWFLRYLTTSFQLQWYYNVEWNGYTIVNCEQENTGNSPCTTGTFR